MTKRLTKQEIKSLESIYSRLVHIYDKFEENDVELHHGNGTVQTQIGCAIASIESILQEY